MASCVRNICAKIRQNPSILLKVTIDNVGVPFLRHSVAIFEFVQWAAKDASFLHQSAFWPFKVVQGHPRSIILVPIGSAYLYGFLLVLVG